MKLFGKSKDKKDPQNQEKVKLRKKGRKKKEAVWGKKERLFVFFVLVVTIGVSAILALSARNWKLPNLPRMDKIGLSFPKPSFSARTIVLQGEEREGNMQKTQNFDLNIQEFEKITKSLSGVYGFYLINLSDDTSYGDYQEESFQAASLIKLPVMATLYQKSEKGEIDLDDIYVLKEEDKVGGSGSLEAKPDGFEISYRELIRLMGKESDNTAFKIAVKLIGEKNLQEKIADLGMTNTSYETNSTTPRDIGIFFKNLYNKKYINEKNTKELFSHLTDTIYEDYLAKGIPENIQVAHKYGRELHVLNDAGIVFSQEPLVMVIMSKGVVESEAQEVFPQIAKKLFDLEENK